MAFLEEENRGDKARLTLGSGAGVGAEFGCAVITFGQVSHQPARVCTVLLNHVKQKWQTAAVAPMVASEGKAPKTLA